ncbi:tRNA (adenosine(37)-N6)-threonylcarbamoyltransferase complex dimerization subunit type 1 TsaB [Chitinibacter fontanus]|uniref:tRNA (Adenosine(37)-N6)-threonylcarbamoyltransferase complex dimerization subunit type 1 TsaB n=1 Tax=Chitinibacter fontanus TaxID=1737446 RepID=A0A7D5V8S0_9NEIS|nr:tRNA (adenosine(37)-N6)-threonylcarbamoyltransferase complex dimerization subunit type 1 TsaB [Chitinibacter fontanus]QLI80460.1 tRNA (adenosine(37)-N6)-threonylcarbamoyltransferase complex dimerization subunit type 1 TsaB [Chitinibacter fontanus]
MPYLAIDTSSEQLSLAISTSLDAATIVARDWPVGQRHAELTLPYLRELLAELQLSMADMAGIAYPSGPGSFTGLRIGCGITQGLAYAQNIPVVGISTLEALAEASGAIRAYVCIDARMNQVYCAAFERQGAAWQTIHAAQVCNPEDVPIPDGNDWFGIGTGFASYQTALQDRIGAHLSQIDAARQPHAREMLKLALSQFAAGQGVSAEQANLVYLRDKVALKTHERAAK